MEDSILLNLVAESNYEAFETIYRKYRQRFCAIAFKMTKCRHCTDEIVQEAFVNVWVNRARLKGVENPSSYLTTIILHSAFAFIKHRTLNEKIKIRMMQCASQHVLSPDEKLVRKEREQWLDGRLAALPDRQRCIFSLTKKCGWSREKVAYHLGISANTVRNHLRAATLSMRVQYRDWI